VVSADGELQEVVSMKYACFKYTDDSIVLELHGKALISILAAAFCKLLLFVGSRL
jgi:hypothetical protein